jgi:hypothetical protein
VPWTEYLLGVLIATYRELERRIGLMTAARGAKTEAVLEAIRHFHGDFSAAELQAQCPQVGAGMRFLLMFGGTCLWWGKVASREESSGWGKSSYQKRRSSPR